MSVQTDPAWAEFYGALSEAARRDLEDVAGAREALARVDARWSDDRLAWMMSRRLTSYAHEEKREVEHRGGRARAVAAVTYYAAVRLQDELRRLRLRQSRSSA